MDCSVSAPANKRRPKKQNGPTEKPLGEIHPSPENDRLYRPVDPADPEIISLAESLRTNGVLEPLVVSGDGWIVSGHRRHCAAKLAGLDRVPCRVLPIRRADDPEGFVRLLREHNRQRDKTLDEKLREEIVSTNPHEAASALYEYRRAAAAVDVSAIRIDGPKRRKRISAAKRPMLDAAIVVIEERRDYWPLTVRQIHYGLLNDPPLKHASKPRSKYQNDKDSYKDLSDLLTRARLEGLVPFAAIDDETRAIVVLDSHPDPRAFMRRELAGFLRGYWRDLMQSQPNHIEIVGEKNTVATILKTVALEYAIPLTTGRGFCSLPPRHAMAERFRKSGKEKLLLLFVSDFDPEGEEIAHSFARSMRDDFGVDAIHPIKVALTAAQVEHHKLPPIMQAKEKSANRKKFVERHGENVYELEALAPDALQQILREAIESVIDRDAYTAETETEADDAAWLDEQRQRVLLALRGIDL